MSMRIVALIASSCVVMLLSQSAASAQETSDWSLRAFKKDSPSDLAYFVMIDSECPVSSMDVEEMVEFTFVTNRINPIHGRPDQSLFVRIALNCISDDDDESVFSIQLHFGNSTEGVPFLYDKDFGSFGSGDGETMLSRLRMGLRAAITAYLQANSA